MSDRSWRVAAALVLAGFAAVALAIGCGAAARPAAPARPDVTPTPAATAPASAQAPARARRVILIVADGMGYAQMDALSLYRYGRRGAASFESFPITAAVSTYPRGGAYDSAAAWGSFDAVRTGFTDSAAAATAMATGHKARVGAIGVDAEGAPLENLVEIAEKGGRSTGLVTSVALSHATPAGFVAHDSDRYDYAGIASQMLSDSALDVVMGAGHPLYSNAHQRARADYRYVGGASMWRKLAAGTLGADANGDGSPDRWSLVQSPVRFTELARGERLPARVAGVAQVRSTLQQKRAGSTAAPFSAKRTAGVPTLATMALGALNVLERDPDGFFLMVESGAGDWAAASNQKGRLIEEQYALDDTVAAVAKWVEAHGGWDETLVIVTADHETGYLAGPGSGQKPAGPVWTEVRGRGRGHLPAMTFHSHEHTNALVPLYAKGAGAQALRDAATKVDTRRGAYLDNTDIGWMLAQVVR